jgi:pimeloyl-ACP methyl ester carboxylesterase
MKFKRILKIIGLGILVLLVVAGAGLFIWSATGTYPAGEIASTALESSSAVQVSQDDWILFTPERTSDVGLIFYPGGLVAPEAYAPVLRQLAERGVFVVITPMPLNLAIFNTNAANTVIESFPDIDAWVLAGHSLGGAAASIYAENHPDEIAGLALWDSYPPDSADLSDNDLEVIAIFGTTDGTANTDNFDDKRDLLPQDTTFVPIEGASHAQFGDYGPQSGDVVPSISAAEQHIRVAALMLEFIARAIR